MAGSCHLRYPLGLVPVILNNIAVHGKDHIKPATAPAVFSQAGASIGVMLKTKNKKLKSLAGSTAVSAVFGITEPAVYGVTLRLKTIYCSGYLCRCRWCHYRLFTKYCDRVRSSEFTDTSDLLWSRIYRVLNRNFRFICPFNRLNLFDWIQRSCG